MGLFNDRLKTAENKTQVPVWFMRQAGRYHSHYQNIKKDSDFMTMCKDPKLACEITMGRSTTLTLMQLFCFQIYYFH